MASVESNYTITGGIRFETLVPERVLIIPNQDNIKTWAEFGIKVTNQTSTPYRFIFFSLIPEIVGPEGKAVEYGAGINHANLPLESDFLLAKPGATLTFLTKAKFFCVGNKLGFGGVNRYNLSWSYRGLRPIKYWVRFTYRKISPTPKISRQPWPFLEELWTGIASSPYEEFYLEYSPD